MDNSLALIRELVNDFREHEKAYLAPKYQESQVRQDFIDKFFTAIGWDVSHQRQKNPYEQEVKIENRMRTEGTQRRADYAFFISPNFRDVKFFVEAKKPAHDLANANYYYQTVRYGWNKTTPIAILTDFEEFHILDCRYKPNIKTVLDHKIETFHYSQYTDEEVFKKIFYLFGRDAIAGGSLEKFVETLPRPRGKGAKKRIIKRKYQQVDEAFLELLDGYRDTLAHAFKNKNPHLDGEALTEAVQRTLDRLVFIRFLEDKGIEEQSISQLSNLAKVEFIPLKAGNLRKVQLSPNDISAWEKFLTLCRSMEPKYNGLVFKQHPVIDSQAFVAPDDKTFGEICGEISDPTSPYDFNTIPISILGSIYERFLGKIVTTTEKRAKVVEKPEVRKAGGVYYTPEYIVRYIVSETVGKMLYEEQSVIAIPLEEREKQSDNAQDNQIASVASLPRNDRGSFRLTPTEVAKLKIIDIACGSGSFLLEVYSQLLDYHTRYYNEFPEKAKKGDTEMREGKIVLSHKKRQEILVNNIYGVDIDFQATEVTQLSLYLKLMEDVTMNDAYQFSLLKERMLPDLRRNIVCGNSLIGRDILDGKLFDDEIERTLKPMNFEDAFPEIMNPSTRSGGGPVRRSPESIWDEGGFDVVVGNPPYIQLSMADYYDENTNSYLLSHYCSSMGRLNSFGFFIERAIKIIRDGGLLGYIIPNTILSQPYYQELRQLILNNTEIEVFGTLDEMAFSEAVVETVVLIFSKERNEKNRNAKRVNVELVTESGIEKVNELTQNIFSATFKNAFNLKLESTSLELKAKIEVNTSKLDNIANLNQAIALKYDRSASIFTKKLNKQYKPVLDGRDINRYSLFFPKNYLLYDVSKIHSCKREDIFIADEKLLFRRVGDRLIATYDDEKYYALNTIVVITPNEQMSSSLKYILALFNSKLLNFYYLKFLKSTKRVFSEIQARQVGQLPIRSINFDDAADKARHDHIVSLVEQMLAAKTKHAAAATESEKNRLDIQIEALDRQIDEAVYELYGLTEEERKIVEGKI